MIWGVLIPFRQIVMYPFLHRSLDFPDSGVLIPTYQTSMFPFLHGTMPPSCRGHWTSDMHMNSYHAIGL